MSQRNTIPDGDVDAPSLVLSWHDAAVVLLLLRSAAPLAATLASLNHGGTGQTSFRDTALSSTSSSTSSMSYNPAFCFDDGALALLPTELDCRQHLNTLLLAVLLNVPPSPEAASECDPSAVAPDDRKLVTAAMGAAEILWHVLTLDGTESIVSGFWDSDDDIAAPANSNTSPRKAALASQLVSIALSWIVAPVIRPNVRDDQPLGASQKSFSKDEARDRILHHTSPSLAAACAAVGGSESDEAAVSAVAEASGAVGQAVLAMIFREAPEARATIIDALAGGALAVSHITKS